jgi:undecaprenyl-diphosphatase
MTLIESLVLALLHGLSRFLPIGAEAHERLLGELLSWPAADGLWRSSFALGALGALVLFFIHDWASILSSWIQMMLQRKKPMTFDERFPFFLVFFAALPAGGYWYLNEQLQMDPGRLLGQPTELMLGAGMAGGGLLLAFAERWSKRIKGLFDIALLDSMLFGIGQCLSVLPGMSGSVGPMSISLLRNYHLEAATKLIPLFALPLLAFEAGKVLSVMDWSAPQPIAGASWMQWSLCLLVSTAASFLSLRVLTDQIRRTGFGGWIVYRGVVGLALLAAHFW